MTDTNEVELKEITNRRSSIFEQLQEKQNDQDFTQRMNVTSAFLFEIYRVLMGTLLIMFVPQKCGDEMCGMTEQLISANPVMNVNFAVNIVTFICFSCLYYTEVTRENKLIEYLDVSKEHARDNVSVGEALKLLPLDKKQQILNKDKMYKYLSYFALGSFVVNSVFSGISVYQNYLDDKTTTVFLTNVMFLASKLGDVYKIANTEENVFLSAYLTRKIQFNYVDEDYMIPEDERVIELNEENLSDYTSA